MKICREAKEVLVNSPSVSTGLLVPHPRSLEFAEGGLVEMQSGSRIIASVGLGKVYKDEEWVV